MIDFSTYRPLSFTSCMMPSFHKVRGKIQLCRCGKCPSCVQSRRNISASLLSREMDNWTYKVFFTLSYDRYHVPMIQIDHDDCGFIKFVPIGRSQSLLRFVPWRPELSYPRDFNGLNPNSEIRYDDLGYIPILHNTTVPNAFGILCYRDVQLFKKRFIKNLFNDTKKHFPSSFREGSPQYCIYTVGEYGTRFYRPHFHLVFMCDCKELIFDLNHFRDIVYDSWSIKKRASGFGRNCYSVEYFADYARFSTELETRGTQERPNFSFVQSASQVASYVSSYVTGFTRIPKVLTFKPWTSKTLSPRGKYGIFGSSKVVRNEIIEKVAKCTEGLPNGVHFGSYFKHVVYSIQGPNEKVVPVALPYANSTLRSLFCKPSGYNSLPSVRWKSVLSAFSNVVFEEFSRRKELDPYFSCPDVLSFMKLADFKASIFYVMPDWLHFLFNRPVESQAQFRNQFCVFGDDLYYIDVGLSNESTWLFCRNGLRTMLEYNLNLDTYMTYFDYLYKILLPQCRLSDFYCEQQLFVDSGISVQSLNVFYDKLPSLSSDNVSWYSTLNIHYPSVLSVDFLDVDRLKLINDWYLSTASCGSYVTESIQSYFNNQLFKHFKHKSRSDF